MNPYKFLFAIEYCFFFSLPLHSALSYSFYCFCMLIKGDFEKKQRDNEFEINLKMHHTKVSFGLNKTRNKVSML